MRRTSIEPVLELRNSQSRFCDYVGNVQRNLFGQHILRMHRRRKIEALQAPSNAQTFNEIRRASVIRTQREREKARTGERLSLLYLSANGAKPLKDIF